MNLALKEFYFLIAHTFIHYFDMDRAKKGINDLNKMVIKAK